MDFFFQCTTVEGQAFLHMWRPTVDRLQVGCGALEAKVKSVPLPLASRTPQPIGDSRAWHNPDCASLNLGRRRGENKHDTSPLLAHMHQCMPDSNRLSLENAPMVIRGWSWSVQLNSLIVPRGTADYSSHTFYVRAIDRKH